VITQDNNNSDIKFLYDDSLTQKFEKMDISAELRVSVLAGLFTLEGSGRYLSSKRTSNRAVHATMRYNITTQVDRLNLFNDALKECISHDALGHDATHVVVEIQWGANSLLTLKDENRDNEDKTDIEGHLAASLKRLLYRFQGKRTSAIAMVISARHIVFYSRHSEIFCRRQQKKCRLQSTKRWR
jgi:hypothetical protein